MAYDMIVDSAKLNGAMKATADAVREKTGGEELIPWDMSEGFKESVEKVYEAGKKAEWNAWWDMIQHNGKRADARSMFAGWGAEYIRPKYKVVPTHSNSRCNTFHICPNLKGVEKQYFDFSQCEHLANNNGGWYYTFSTCNKLEFVEDIGIGIGHNMVNTFAYCYELKTIECIHVKETVAFSDAFRDCRELVNLTIDGVIGQNGFNVQWSTKLSKESHISIVNAFSTTATISATFSKIAVDKAFETSAGANDGSTSAEWLSLVGTRPNVTVSLA